MVRLLKLTLFQNNSLNFHRLVNLLIAVQRHHSASLCQRHFSFVAFVRDFGMLNTLVLCQRVLLFRGSDSIQQEQQQPFYGPLSRTTQVSQYQKKHSPTNHPDHHPIFISFFHLPRNIASSLFKLRAWQSFCTTSFHFHVLFGLPLGLEPSTSYSIHFFTQSVYSFHSTCLYHCNLFRCSINIISSIPSLFLNSLLGTLSFTLTLHIHLTILISAR